MDHRRLGFAGDDDAFAAIFFQIANDRGNPGFKLRVLSVACGIGGDAEPARDAPRDFFNFAAAQRQAVIGHCPRDRRCAFDDVEPVHLLFSAAHAASVGEIAGVAKPLRMRVKKIRFKRKNHGGFIEAMLCFHQLAESDPRAFANVVP